MSVIVQDAARVRVVRIDAEARGNAITCEAVLGPLTDAVSAAPETADVLILTGTGRFFSAGGDIDDLLAAEGMFGGDPLDLHTRYRAGVQRLVRDLYMLPIPTIAAVNGAAVGAGTDLVLACDLRLAGRSARLISGFARLGLVPGDGGAWLMLRTIGAAAAAEFALCGQTWDAEEALARGLVSRVVDDEALMDTAQTLAAQIAAQPQGAIRRTKHLLRRAALTDFETAQLEAAGLQALSHRSAEHCDIVEALREQRVDR